MSAIVELENKIASHLDREEASTARKMAVTIARVLAPAVFEEFTRAYEPALVRRDRLLWIGALEPTGVVFFNLINELPVDGMSCAALTMQQIDVPNENKVKVFQGLAKSFPLKMKHVAYRELWRVGMTNDQFKNFCQMVLSDEMFYYEAKRRVLGRQPGERANTATVSLSRSLYDSKKRQQGTIYGHNLPSPHKIQIPILYYLEKSPAQRVRLRDTKQYLCKLSLCEEP